MRIGEICQALKYLQNSVTKRLEIRILKNKHAWDKKKKKTLGHVREWKFRHYILPGIRMGSYLKQYRFLKC